MASLIPSNGVLLNIAKVAPAPSKDYCQLYITRTRIIFRWWKISLRNESKVTQPGEVNDSYEDFRYDERTQSEISRVFGRPMVDYVLRLAKGHIDYFSRLPNHLLIRIAEYLELEDVCKLAQTCKQYNAFCQSDALWEAIYIEHSETPVTSELVTLAEAIGWKKLFFTNKLQLQVQLRRMATKRASEAKNRRQVPTNTRPSKPLRGGLDDAPVSLNENFEIE